MKRSLEMLSKDERSLLLYLETRAVDEGGSINTLHLNDIDKRIIKSWFKSGFIEYGRIVHEDVERFSSSTKRFTNWCRLGPEAWDLAHEERRARAERKWGVRTWITTKEVREEKKAGLR